MARFEIRVTINRPLSEVFDIYTQPDAFRWTNLRSIRWASGRPWKVGSRLRIELDDAYGTPVDQLLTDFEPDAFVAFISHFGGITMQSQVHFRAISRTQTEIEAHMEFIDRFSRISSLPLGSSIEQATRQFYDDLKRECERTVAHKHRRSTRVPLMVGIETREIGTPQKCEGETVVVNCHGALISTIVPLQVRMRIEVRVIPTGRHTVANVVHVDPEQPRRCGIGLVHPENIWGLARPPDDWPGK